MAKSLKKSINNKSGVVEATLRPREKGGCCVQPGPRRQSSRLASGGQPQPIELTSSVLKLNSVLHYLREYVRGNNVTGTSSYRAMDTTAFAGRCLPCRKQ